MDLSDNFCVVIMYCICVLIIKWCYCFMHSVIKISPFVIFVTSMVRKWQEESSHGGTSAAAMELPLCGCIAGLSGSQCINKHH